MTAWALLGLIALVSYLVGAIPFGYLVARAKGIDILQAGSGNIGATNVARVVGKPWGLLVFALDFAKGAVPVFASHYFPFQADLLPNTLPVVAGISAFLGHLFPIYLGFRGGKGVATGAGVVAVLVPDLALYVLGAWILVLLLTRFVSLASCLAAALLLALRLALTSDPWQAEQVVVTSFCAFACALVILRHHGNIRRLINGTEPRIGARHPERDF